MRTVTFLSFSFLVAACGGRGGDTATTSDDGSANTADTATDTGSAGSAGFGIEGTAVNLMAQDVVAPEGLCVHVADPTPAIAGKESEILVSTTVGADGAYAAAGVETTSILGLLMIVEDCNDEGTVMATATGVGDDTYEGLGAGDVIADKLIFSMDGDSLDSLSSALADAGYPGDMETGGGLVGFVTDADGQAVGGAVVTGKAEPDATANEYHPFYLQEDGTFTTGEGASTDVATGAMFVIPEAPIYNYSCEAEGYEFESFLAGSQAGYAVVVGFDAL